MNTSTIHRLIVATFVAVGLLAASACSDDCPPGTPGCECFANDTCMIGLSCDADRQCVNLADNCVEDVYCVGQHRTCVEEDGRVSCGDCLSGYDETDGGCMGAGGLCEPGSCSGHGLCDDSGGAASCACNPGYLGEHCDSCDTGAGYHWNTMGTECTLDPCDPDPCTGQVGRTCDGRTGTCGCLDGYCDIGGSCVADGDADPEHGCQICDTTLDPSSWTLRAADAVCREAVDDCDVAEVCDGTSIECPADALESAGASCGDGTATDCDNPDTCDGLGACLPNFEPATTVCRAVAGACDLEDTCDGGGLCPNRFEIAGVVCDDGDPCTTDEICTGIGGGTEQCIGAEYSCNGHGTCDPTGDACLCDTGYTDSYCDACATNFQDNDDNGTCLPNCDHPSAPVCGGGYESCRDESGTAACWTSGFAGIPGGTFAIGSLPTEAGHQTNEVLHEVNLTGGFEVQITELTQAQWRAVAAVELWGIEPSHNAGCDDCPVDSVSWYEAIAYANALSRQSGLEECYFLQQCQGIPGGGCAGASCDGDYLCAVARPRGGSSVYRCSGYRLPTEAEWEYFARAGSQTPFHPSQDNDGSLVEPGCADPNLARIGWYCGNSDDTSQWVGGRAANDWGFYDSSGNVWEWTWDLYRASYEDDETVNPQGPSTGHTHVIRGGSFESNAQQCRSATRFDAPATERSSSIGFRLVRSLDPDGDGIDSVYDNCPYHYNPDQSDYDGDGLGDPCNPMQIITAGTFVMGSPDGLSCPPDNPSCTVVPPAEPDRNSSEVQHLVTLTRDFEMMTYEVTVADWREVVAWVGAALPTEPSTFPNCGDACPVDGVFFTEILQWTNALSRRDNLPECYVVDHCQSSQCVPRLNNFPTIYDCPGYRLPTEAEWEYAARAGSQTPFYPSDGNDGTFQTSDPDNVVDSNLDQIASYGLNSVVTYAGGYECPWGDGQFCGPQPVGSKEPNAWGLYDLLGNGLELQWDIEHEEFDGSAQIDPVYSPTEIAVDDVRVGGRGGGYFAPGSWLRNAARGAGWEWSGTDPGPMGFRLVRTLDADGDGVPAYVDNCPGMVNADQADDDGDGVGDPCDNCPSTLNPSQTNSDTGQLVVAHSAICSEGAGAVVSTSWAILEDCGDTSPCTSAWRPSGSGSAQYWIELTFPPTRARGLWIREVNLTGGFVTAVETVAAGQSERVQVWAGDDPTDWTFNRNSRWFRLDFHRTSPAPIERVRIHTAAPGLEQIDAVFLVADDGLGDACDPATDASTVQSFDATGTGYVLFKHHYHGRDAHVLRESDNHYLRLTHSEEAGNANAVAFDRSHRGAPQQISAEFDFRITPEGLGADGMAIVFLSTAEHGPRGRSPLITHEPNIAGSLGIGFDIYGSDYPTSENHLSVHFDGNLLGTPPGEFAPSFDLENGLWNHARVVLTSTSSVTFAVDVYLTPSGGSESAVISGLVVNAPLYESRVAFGADTGGVHADQDVDNIVVEYQ